MTIFDKIKAGIERFKSTADRAEHMLLADTLADQNFVAEWHEARLVAIEKELGIKSAPLPTGVEKSTLTSEVAP